MASYNVSKEYGEILEKYLTNFGLEPIDVAFLIKTKKDVINGLLTGKKGVVLKTLEKISQLFNQRYYEFGNPNFPMPKFESLPEKTRSRILYRSQLGPHDTGTYTSSHLNEKI